MPNLPPDEPFSPEERAALRPYFTNADRPVFALRNLPEVVKGALFARYSRSAKSLRRLFLDEFHEALGSEGDGEGGVGVERAEKLYERVFGEYGDDSVAQLGVAHVACEGVSNILTKVLEWGRLMSYLEQSTRYVPYTDKPGDRWKYHIPEELEAEPALLDRYVTTLDGAFETYARWIDPMREYFEAQIPQEGVSNFVYKATIRAKALDALRGLMPAATRSNVGICGSGQGYEALLLRMRGHPSEEVRNFSAMLLAELREVIPAFLTRVDRPDRGDVWTDYLATNVRETKSVADALFADLEYAAPPPRPEVTLTDFDPSGERKVVAAALYASCDLPDDTIQARVRAMTNDERADVLRAYVGDRNSATAC